MAVTAQLEEYIERITDVFQTLQPVNPEYDSL